MWSYSSCGLINTSGYLDILTPGNSCKHGPLCEERDKGWLKANSPFHDVLVAIVLDKRFINRIPGYSFIEV